MNLLPTIDSKRNYGLDILRAIAILSVLFTHATMFVPTAARSAYQWLQLDGVAIFFVLSGFLIGGILVRTLENNPATPRTLWRFWLMRWFRTVPPYFFILLLIMLWDGGQSLLKAIINHKRYFIFFQNFTTPHQEFFTEGWSLSVEEWFYLIVGSSSVLLARFLKPRTALLVAAVVIIATSTGLRLYQYLHYPPADINAWGRFYRTIVVYRLDSLMYGVLGVIWSIYAPVSWLAYSRTKCLLGIALLIICILPSKPIPGEFKMFWSVWSFSLTGLGTMLVIPFLSQIKTGKGFTYKFITYTSLFSYSMYLLNGTIIVWHIIMPFAQSIGLNKQQIQVGGFISFFVLTYVLSAIMYQTVEVGSLRLRKRIVG